MPFILKKAAMKLRDSSAYIPLPGMRGDEGPTGPAGPGVPAGGTTGQVLAKTSGADYATGWVNQSGGGGGTSDYDDLTDKPSINNVTLSGNKTAAELGLGTYSKPSGGIPKTDLASAVQTSLGKADTALQSAPVTSVNSKTGAVSLSASDVGALSDDTAIPSKTSDLTNDSGFITSAPVTSVNNKTGAVMLTASDVGAGTYSKPSGGIPQTDLASAVQSKLDNTVVVSDTQPTATENKLWVDTDAGTGTSYQVPTVVEMEAQISSHVPLFRTYSIGSEQIAAGATRTITYTIPSIAGYTPRVMSVHIPDTSNVNYAKVFLVWNNAGTTINAHVFNTSTALVAPSPYAECLYLPT